MTGRRMVQDDVENFFHRRPGEEINKLQRVRERSENFMNRTRLALSLQCTLHEIEVSVRHLKSYFLQPCSSRQNDVREPAGGLAHEKINADNHLRLVQTIGNSAGIGERRQHVRAKQKQDF